MPRDRKIGAPPGTLVHIGEKMNGNIKISQITYDKEGLEEYVIPDVINIELDATRNNWIDIQGLHDVDVIAKLGKKYDIHSLVLEDIVNTEHRPKIEEYEDYVFIILKTISGLEGNNELEQVSILLGKNYVFTFQEGNINNLGNIRERLKNQKGKLRTHSCDFLAYSIIDALIDKYFLLTDQYADTIQHLEDEIIHSPDKDSLLKLQKMKNEVANIRKTIYPVREIINRFEKVDNDFMDQSTTIYLRDIYDHAIQIIEAIDTYRETLSGLIEVYLSNLSNRMNEVMKVLTIIATIFIPLSFLAGVFGMNFVYMPELGWRYSYPIFIISMCLIATSMLYFFKKKGWI